MKTGDKVRQIVPVINGVITKTEYDEETEQLKHLVEYESKDENGDAHTLTRWFKADELEAAK
jgi:hypothetical protein